MLAASGPRQGGDRQGDQRRKTENVVLRRGAVLRSVYDQGAREQQSQRSEQRKGTHFPGHVQEPRREHKNGKDHCGGPCDGEEETNQDRVSPRNRLSVSLQARDDLLENEEVV